MRAEWLGRFRRPLVALVLLSAPMAWAQPVVASPVESKTNVKVDRARVDRLLQQIRELAELSPLSVDRALTVLGTQKGASRPAGKYTREWDLAPTDLIAGGRIGHGTAKPYAYVEIRPAAAVGLAFEDVARLLLNVPYTMEVQNIHPFEDSLATRTRGIYHTFVVPAGEVQIYFRSSAPYSAADQAAKARAEGRDTARGVSPLSTRPLESVTIGTASQPRGTNLKTLADLRAAPSGRDAGSR